MSIRVWKGRWRWQVCPKEYQIAPKTQLLLWKNNQKTLVNFISVMFWNRLASLLSWGLETIGIRIHPKRSCNQLKKMTDNEHVPLTMFIKMEENEHMTLTMCRHVFNVACLQRCFLACMSPWCESQYHISQIGGLFLVVPVLERWRLENQKFRVIFSSVSLSLAWAVWNPVLIINFQ